jgi:hypothetical protein
MLRPRDISRGRGRPGDSTTKEPCPLTIRGCRPAFGVRRDGLRASEGRGEADPNAPVLGGASSITIDRARRTGVDDEPPAALASKDIGTSRMPAPRSAAGLADSANRTPHCEPATVRYRKPLEAPGRRYRCPSRTRLPAELGMCDQTFRKARRRTSGASHHPCGPRPRHNPR